MTSNTFSYTTRKNPYSQTPPPPLEHLLKQLIRSRGTIPAVTAIQTLHNQLSLASRTGTEVDWTLELAQGLATYTIHLLELWTEQRYDPSHSSDKSDETPTGMVAVIYLLITAMEQWEDDILYAVVVQTASCSKQQRTLLDILLDLSLMRNKQPLPAILALQGLASAWRALERIQWYTDLDPTRLNKPWWMMMSDESKVLNLSFAAVDYLLR